MAHAFQRHLGFNCIFKQTSDAQTVKTKLLPRIVRVFGRIRLWNQKCQQRRALLVRDDRQLSDIGISLEDAKREASRPFWD